MSTQLEVIMQAIQKIGIREFRAHLPEYLMTSSPVAITRHGETVGFYIPAKHQNKEAEIYGLKQAALSLEKLMASYGLSEEDLFLEFRKLRKKKDKKGR